MRTLYLSTSQNLQKAWFIGEDCKPTKDFRQAKKFKNLDHFFGWVEQHRILLAEGVTYATDLDTTIARTDFILCYSNDTSIVGRYKCSGTVQHHESKRPVGLITTLRRIGLAQSLIEKNCLQHFENRLIFVRQLPLWDLFATSRGEYTNDILQALTLTNRNALDKYIKDLQGQEAPVRNWCIRSEARLNNRLVMHEDTRFSHDSALFKLCRIHVTKYNTIEFVDVHSEGINNYADVLKQIFYKHPYDDKVDAVANALAVYSGTRNPYMKTLQKHLLNSLYGIEGLHFTTDGIKAAYNLSAPRWELDESKSKFELDYSLHHPEYNKRPEFLTKCFNMPYDLNMPFDEQLKAEGFFEPPRYRVDYTKMYKNYDPFSNIDPNAGVLIYDGDTDVKISEGYRKELRKKIAEQFGLPYSVLEAADDIVETHDNEGENDMRLRVPEIKKVIFNKPAVIVLWKDGTKTIVKAQGKSRYDKEKGLAMAIAKKALGNEGNYYNEFRKWLEE
jgi:hypothetical protein